MNFTHLHVHTSYSFLDGQCKHPELIARAKELGMNAIAITDHNHLGGTYSFQQECKKQGIKPILGYEVYWTEDRHILAKSSDERNILAAQKALSAKVINQEEYDAITTKGSKKSSKIKVSDIREKIKPYAYDTKQYHLILIAMDQEGWNNIIKLQSESAVDCTFNGRFLCDNELLERYSEGILCTTACIANRIARYINRDNDYAAAENLLIAWNNIFKGRFFLEIQPLNHIDQVRVNKFYTEMSKKYFIPLVATNDVHYIYKEDHDDHDTLLCIGTGKKKSDYDRMKYTNDFWLRSYDEMLKAFQLQYEFNYEELPENYLDRVKEALENTNKVADRIEENIKIGSDVPLIPKVKLKEGQNAPDYLTIQCFKNLYKLAETDEYVKEHLREYEKRLDTELDVIIPKGFADYFLVVQEYVEWCRHNHIIVGPGRGSAAGSLALYLLGITKIADPLKYHLLFERFLSKDRTALPD